MLIEETISTSSASEIKNEPVEGLTRVKKEKVYNEEPTEWFTMVNYDIIPTAPEEIDYNPEYSGSAPTTNGVKDEPQQIDKLGHEEIDIKDEPLENASKKVGRKRGKTKTEEQVFQCHNCGFKTTNKATLKSHVKFHSRRKPFACNICSYKTVDKSNLNSHMKIHTGEKPHECSHCGYKTTSKYYLMQHETIHAGTKLFKCDICGHETRYRISWSRHMRRHTGEKSPERIYLCDQCDYHCKSRKQLNRHKLSHTDEKPFECSECEFRTKHKLSLKSHTKKKHMREVIGIDHVLRKVIVKNAMQLTYKLYPHNLPEDFNTYTNSEKYLAEIKELMKYLPEPHQSRNTERSFTKEYYFRQAQSVVEVASTVNTVQRNELPAYASHHNNNQSLIQQSVNSASRLGRIVGQDATAPHSNNELLSDALYNNKRLIQQSSTANGRNVGKVAAPYSNTAQYLHLQRNEPLSYPLNNNKRLIQQPPLKGRNEQTTTVPYSNNVHNTSFPSYTNTNKRLIQQSSTENGRNVRKVAASNSNTAQYLHLQRDEPPSYLLNNNKRLIQQPPLNGRNEQTATVPYSNNVHNPSYPSYTNTNKRLIQQSSTENGRNGRKVTAPYSNNAQYPYLHRNELPKTLCLDQ